MRNLTATICLTIAVLLGSTSVLVVPISAEAGLASAILKGVFGELDKGAKKIDGAVTKTEGEGYSYFAQFVSRALRELFRENNKCPNNLWATSVFQNTNIYSEPKITSKIIGTLDKDEKVCVVEEEGEWVKTFYGWVEKQSVTWVSEKSRRLGQ